RSIVPAAPLSIISVGHQIRKILTPNVLILGTRAANDGVEIVRRAECSPLAVLNIAFSQAQAQAAVAPRIQNLQVASPCEASRGPDRRPARPGRLRVTEPRG